MYITVVVVRLNWMRSQLRFFGHLTSEFKGGWDPHPIFLLILWNPAIYILSFVVSGWDPHPSPRFFADLNLRYLGHLTPSEIWRSALLLDGTPIPFFADFNLRYLGDLNLSFLDITTYLKKKTTSRALNTPPPDPVQQPPKSTAGVGYLA